MRATGSLKVDVATTAPTSDSTGQGTASQTELAQLAGARHPVMGDWVGITTGHSVNGSRILTHDSIHSVTLSPPYAAGTFDWDIQWFIRVIGARSEKAFATATHSEVVTATGQMTISKGGFSVTRQASDPTSSW